MSLRKLSAQGALGLICNQQIRQLSEPRLPEKPRDCDTLRKTENPCRGRRHDSTPGQGSSGLGLCRREGKYVLLGRFLQQFEHLWWKRRHWPDLSTEGLRRCRRTSPLARLCMRENMEGIRVLLPHTSLNPLLKMEREEYARKYGRNSCATSSPVPESIVEAWRGKNMQLLICS
jgi:hypothetical protein